MVTEGEVIMILESMKMEIAVEAPVTGTILKIKVATEESDRWKDGALIPERLKP